MGRSRTVKGCNNFSVCSGGTQQSERNVTLSRSSGVAQTDVRQRMESLDQQRTVRHRLIQPHGHFQIIMADKKSSETQYFYTDVDSAGCRSNGRHSYEMTLAPALIPFQFDALSALLRLNRSVFLVQVAPIDLPLATRSLPIFRIPMWTPSRGNYRSRPCRRTDTRTHNSASTGGELPPT